MIRYVELQNLFVGPSLGNVLREQLESLRIGHFAIKFLPSYDQIQSQLSQLQTVSHNFSAKINEPGKYEQKVTPPTFSKEWITTAIAEFDDSVETHSILLSEPVNDFGIWDLCEILTLTTGRRVSTPLFNSRHGAAHYFIGNPLCHVSGALIVAESLWPGRENVVKLGVELALLTHNDGMSHLIQTKAAHFTTALDIICSQMVPQSTAAKDAALIPKPVKKSLADALANVIRAQEGLTDDQKVSYEKVVTERVNQGLAKGFTVKLLDTLIDFGAIDLPITPEVRERVSFIDTLRNKIIHEGRIPLPGQGQSTEQITKIAGYAVYRVISAILHQAS